MTTHPIIIFDSGVGGFSILREVLSRNYSHSIIYLADQAGFPYGDKSPAWIKNRLSYIASWANSYSPAIFVLACNTATVSGVDYLRSLLPCPVVAVEPVTKPLSQYKHPLLLATSTTLQTANIDNIATLCPKGLVQAIEDMNQGKIKKIITSLDSIIKNQHINAIGLSCTHYPLVSDIIVQLYPDITIIDPSVAVVDHFFSLIKFKKTGQSQLSFHTTSSPTTLTNQVRYYLDLNITAKGIEI